MNISILTYNNKVGIVTDAMLLKKILEEIYVTTSIIFIDKIQSVPNNDVGIWIQDFDYNYLNELGIMMCCICPTLSIRYCMFVHGLRKTGNART